jgi:hypothetical protein
MVAHEDLAFVVVERVDVPRLPHHLTQRGNRRQRTFLRAEDYVGFTGNRSFPGRCQVLLQ